MPSLPASNFDPKIQKMTGGVNAVPATGVHERYFLSGTWTAEDTFDLVVSHNQTQYDLGADHGLLNLTPRHVMAYRDQIFLCADDKLFFSGIKAPTGWETRFPGYGYIQMSGNRGEALATMASTIYAGKLALFSRNNIQLWLPNPDPALWQLVQTLENTGTVAPQSVVSFGNLDVFYLADTGIRSLRLREFTDLVNVEDVGVAIDDAIKAKLVDTTGDINAKGYYSLRDGRYFLFLDDYVYAFSYFPGAKVSAWTRLETDKTAGQFGVNYATSKGQKLYVLTDTSKLLIGPSSLKYFESTVVIPYFDAKKPFTRKHWQAIDIIGEGTWKVEVGNDTSNENNFTIVAASLTLPSTQYARVPLGLMGTHLIIKLTNAASLSTDSVSISSIGIHYKELEAS